MNWLKSIQKRTRRLLVFLEKTQKPILVPLVPLVTLVPLAFLAIRSGSLVGLLVGSLAATLEKKEKNGPRLILPPGAWLRNVLHTIYPPKTAERIFDQIIADMQLEWQEAMIHEKKLLARWVRVRGVLTVLLTAVVHVVATLGSILKLVRLG